MKKAKENDPKMQRATASVAAFTPQMSQQLLDNPRLARLMQLANDKKCKGGS